MVSSWSRYVDLHYGGVPNLSSFIRICCLMHMCEQERDSLAAFPGLMSAGKQGSNRAY
ncbi:hypothetical protein D3C72_2562780 [compost metagenome]